MNEFDELMQEMDAAEAEELEKQRLAEEVSDESEENEAEEEYAPRRPKQKKKRKKKHYFLRFCIFLLVVFGVFRFMHSDFFRVTDIHVEGNSYYTKAQIIELAGLRTGYNLFFETDTRPARKALLSDPYIRLASVKKVPRGTIEVLIEEREEYAAVPYGDEYIIIDPDGMVLRVADREPVLPLLGGMSLVSLEPGKPLEVEQTYLLTDTLKLIASMKENDVYFRRIVFSSVIVRAYIYDELYCEGTPENILANMPGINKLIASLLDQSVSHGVIKVGTDGYLAFSPQYD